MIAMLAPLVGAVVQGLVTPVRHAVTGAANKALAAGGIAGASVGSMPSSLELFAAIGYLLDWTPESVHAASVIGAFVTGFVVTYLVPNRPPKE